MLERLVLAWRAWRFRGQRADYYDYLAALMGQGDGRKTLLDILSDDARRHGRHSTRGALAEHWARRYREVGGDLSQTFAHTLPADDLGLLRAVQLAGGGALVAGLRDLASATRLIDGARQGVTAALATAGVACFVLLLMLAATPGFTVPTLKQTFQGVPSDYWGGSTRALFGLAESLEQWLLPLLVVALLVPLLAYASLGLLTGTPRRWLDSWLVWRLYRDFQGMRFLALLGTLVAPHGNLGLSLRDALLAQWTGANRWKRWHLQRMIERVDDGVVGAGTFATGLLQRDMFWFLSDMLAMHGLEAGLACTRQRLEAQWLGQLLRRARRLRWALLLTALTALLGLTFWHYGVIDELRRSLQSYYAARP